MHKRCREIMDELILNGELEEITWFEFAPKQELKLRLKDMLEDEVDEKYLLNQELVSKYLKTGTTSNHKGSQAGKVADENDETFWTVNAGTHGYSIGYVKIDKKYHLPQERLETCLNSNHSAQRVYCPSGIAPTISAGSNGGGKEPVKMLYRSHTLNIKGNDSIKRIYSSDGHNPSLTTMQGGNREPKIAHPVREVGRRLDENGKRCDDNKDIPITRRYEIGAKEISNCLSGVQKDSYVAIANGVIEIENDKVRERGAVFFELENKDKKLIHNPLKGISGKGWHFEQNVYSENSFCTRALKASQGSGNIQKVITNKYIFRKLTPRECFRLQGFDDNFIFAPKMSDSQLYKQAGNGMSRNILDMIFTQIFTCYAKHIEKTKELK